MTKETCSCGASIEGDVVPAALADWRANHRHEMPRPSHTTVIRPKEYDIDPVPRRPRINPNDNWQLPRPPIRSAS